MKIIITKPDVERTARVFGCSIDNAKRLFNQNAKGFLEMAEKARESEKKVNGYTETQLRQSASDYLEASK